MLAVAMSACRCGFSAGMNPIIERNVKMGLEGVRPWRNQHFWLPFLLKISRK
jgi:hypothetical protein